MPVEIWVFSKRKSVFGSLAGRKSSGIKEHAEPGNNYHARMRAQYCEANEEGGGTWNKTGEALKLAH